MKGITKIALSIALLAIVVLSIVVASVAWFTSNSEVDADSVTLNAARTLTVTFDADVDGSNNNKGYRYNGETGRGAQDSADAPYVYEAGSFVASISPSASAKGGKVKITFGTVEVKYGRHPSSVISGTVSDVLITDLFTITANCYEKSDEPDPSDPADNYIKVNGMYLRDDGTHDGEQHYKKTIYVIDDDGFVKTAGGDVVAFPQGEYGFSFTFTFLPEAAYALWTEGRYSEIYGYRPNTTGAYTGLLSYVPYCEKYHSSLPRYSVTNDGAGTGTLDAAGDYVRAVTATGYVLNASVAKYVKNGNEYVRNDSTGTYVRVGASEDYVLLSSLAKFDRVEGFPFSGDESYLDATYTFDVTCTVEEVEVA